MSKNDPIWSILYRQQARALEATLADRYPHQQEWSQPLVPHDMRYNENSPKCYICSNRKISKLVVGKLPLSGTVAFCDNEKCRRAHEVHKKLEGEQ